MAENELVPVDIIADFGRARVKTYMHFAAISILVYEYFLTLSSEVKLIWPSKMSITKCLYFYTKYSAFIDSAVALVYSIKTDISVVECQRMDLLDGWLMTIGIIMAEVILVIRTWALWGRGKCMAITLFTVFISTLIVSGIIEGLYIKTRTFMTFPGKHIPECFLVSGSSTIGITFVLVIVVETMVLILTVMAGFQRFRFAGRTQGITSVLYRDGVMFYVYSLTISLTNFIVTYTRPEYSRDLLTHMQRVLHSCLSARVLLNLRAAGMQHDASNLMPQSSIMFAAPVASENTTTRATVTAPRIEQDE